MVVLRLLALFVSLAIVIVARVYLNLPFSKGYVFDADLSSGIVAGMSFAIVALTGAITASVLWKTFNEETDTSVYRAFLVLPLSSTIFAIVLNCFGQDANIVMSIAFAFQNAFFWQVTSTVVIALNSKRRGLSGTTG